jgi:L-fuconolactonase
MDPIVDSHVHLWDPRYLPIDWLEQIPLLNAPYGLAEYAAATAGVDVAAFVYVQVEADAAYGLVEARWAAARAEDDPRLGAIVAWAPVERGAQLRAYLDSLVAVDGRITGVRRLFQTEPDARFGADAAVAEGVQMLGRYGLSFDLGVRRDQIQAASELARCCPETRFVLDHLAFPNLAGRELDPWRRDLATLAQLPNVACKLSGLATVAGRADWTAGDLAPYVLHALDVFGPRRVMFGSDWPVMLQASSYTRWLEAIAQLLSGLSTHEQHLVWAENAREWYRIGGSRPAPSGQNQEPAL